MSETYRNLLVGAFVITSLVVLAILLAWFGEAPEWLGGHEWTLRITGVQGLQGVKSGTPVQMNGVEIGRVRSLDFIDAARPDAGVVIVAGIKDTYIVPQRARARVYGATLGFGSGHVAIHVPPGELSKPLAKEDARIPGEMRSIVNEIVTKELLDSVQRMITNIGSFADAATPVAQNLAELLERRTVAEVRESGVQPTLATVVERLDQLVANLNTILGDDDVRGDFRSAVRDLKSITGEIRETVALWKQASQELADNLNGGIDRTEAHIDESFAKVIEVLDRLDETATGMAVSVQSIRDGEGTAGKLIRDDRLYEAAVLSLERLADSMSRLQAILAKVERDGYITIGQAPTGILRAKFPLAADDNEPGASKD